MNLIIDQGNTAIKVAVFDGALLKIKKVFPPNDYESLSFWVSEQIKDPLQFIFSTVTDSKPVLKNIKLLTQLELNAELPLPIQIAYETPKTLGNDRIANACAIWKLNPRKNSLAIDLGTCIKYDLVTADGSYRGGAISPGLDMRFKALHEFTAKLPKVSADQQVPTIGTSTSSSLAVGVNHGIVYEINGFIERYSQDFDDLTIFMTGGDLKHFDKGFKNPIFANPDLTLIGLNEILQYNVQQK